MASKQKSHKKLKRQKLNINTMLPRPKAIIWGGKQELLEEALKYPIYGCWIDEGWEEHGLAQVVVARQQSPGRIFFGVYLVDYYCLGIKNCYWLADTSERAFQRHLDKLPGIFQRCDPALAHELIYGALEYAEYYGFKPQEDFREARLVLELPETYPPTGKVEFGYQGKPLFIEGPNDDTKRILARLEQTAGQGDYDYLIKLDSMDEDNLIEGEFNEIDEDRDENNNL
jgi:hypothetical protein